MCIFVPWAINLKLNGVSKLQSVFSFWIGFWVNELFIYFAINLDVVLLMFPHPEILAIEFEISVEFNP